MANTFTNFFPTLFSDIAYFEFASAAVAPQVANMTWVDPGGAAEAIRIPKFTFQTSDIDDVSNLVDSPDNVTEATVLLNLDREKGFHYEIKYTEQDKANVQLGESVLRQRALALASVVDQDVFETISGADNTLTGVINKANIVSAAQLLNSANAPQTDRVLVVGPEGYSDLLNTDDFVRNDSVAGAQANATGLVGFVLGFETYLSNNLPSTVSGGGFAAHRAAIAMAMLKTIEVKVFDQPRHFSTGYTGRATWGQTLIDSSVIVQMVK